MEISPNEGSWAADTPVSRPEAANGDVLVDFQGFAFTMKGMTHNLSESDVEALITPTYAPDGYQGQDYFTYDEGEEF